MLEFGVEDGSELEPKPDFTQDNSSLYTDAELFNFSDESVSPQDYITNRQAKEATPWYFRFFGLDDLYRGTKHGYYNAKDSYGGSKLAAGKIANEASSGSGNELIKDGLAIIDNAAIDKKDIGYKKSDSWEGVDGFSEALWDFVPYQIGSVLPMIAEIILVGYGTGKAFEKIGKSEKAIINKEKPKSGTRKFIEKAAGRTKFLPTAPGKVINKALEGAKLAYKVKDALVVANNTVKKFITAPAFKQRITDRVRLIDRVRSSSGKPALTKLERKNYTKKYTEHALRQPGTQELLRRRLGNVVGTHIVLERYGQGEVFGRAVEEAIKNEPDPQVQLDLINQLPTAKLATLGFVHSVTDQILVATVGKSLREVSRKTANAFLAVTAGMATLGTESGVAEVAQNVLTRYGADLPLADKEAIQEYINSFAAGFAAIAPFGAAGGKRDARANKIDAVRLQKNEELRAQVEKDAINKTTRSSVMASENQQINTAVDSQVAKEFFNTNPVTATGFNGLVLDLLGLRPNSVPAKRLPNLDLNDVDQVQTAIDILETASKPEKDGGLSAVKAVPIRAVIDQLKAKLDPNYVPSESSESLDTTVDTTVGTGDPSGTYAADLDAAIVDIKANGNTNITQPRLNKILKGAPQNVIDETMQRLREEGFFIGTKNAEKTAINKAAKINTNNMRPGEGLISDPVKETDAETQARFDESIEKERLEKERLNKEKERLNKESQDRLDKTTSAEFNENSQSDLDLDNNPQFAKGIDTQQDTQQEIRQQLSDAQGELIRAESVRRQDYERLKNPRKKAELDRNVEVAKQKVLNLEAQISAETPAQIEANKIAKEKALIEIRELFGVNKQEARAILNARQVIRNTGETTESITESFTNQYGKNIIQGIKQGLINIVENVEDLTNLNIPNFSIDLLPAGAKAFMLNGKAYFIANRITRNESPGLLLHEIGAHYGLKRMLGAKKYNELVAALKNRRNSDKDISAAFDYVTEAYPELTENTPAFIEEVIARVSESAPNNSMYRTIVANIKAFLRKLGMGLNVDNLSARQIQDLVQHSLKSALKEKTNTQIFPQDINRLQAAKQTPQDKGAQEELRRRDSPSQKRIRGEADGTLERETDFPDKFDMGGFKKKLRKISTGGFDFERGLALTVKQAMVGQKETIDKIKQVLYDMSAAQAVHFATMAKRFSKSGGIVWDEAMKVWRVVEKEASIFKALEKAKEAAKEYGLTIDTMREIVTRYAIGLRTVELQKSNKEAQLAKQNSKYQAILKRAEAEKIKSTSPEAAQALEAEAKNINIEADLEFKRKYVVLVNELEHLAADLDYGRQYPKIVAIHKMLIDTKNEALKFAVVNQLMSEEQLEELTGIVLTEKTLETRADIHGGLIDVFVPFYRQGKQGDRTNQKGLEERGKYFKIRGSFEPVADVFDNMDRFVLSAITRGGLNDVALKKLKWTKKYLPNDIRTGEDLSAKDIDTVEVSEVIDGKQQSVLYKYSDPMLAAAISGIESINLPGLNLAASTSNLFRSNIILYPGFGLSQLSQDALTQFTTSGTWLPFMIVPRVIKNFVGTMIGVNKIHDNLESVGAVGEWSSYTQAVDDIEDNPDWNTGYNTFRRGLGKLPGITRGNPIEITGPSGKPANLSISGFLHRIAMASDNSIRESVYEQVMFETKIRNYLKNKRSGKPTSWKETKGDGQEAVHKALEIINFKRAGSSPVVNGMRRTVAFSGAMLQALSVQYRVFSLEGIAPSTKMENAGKLLSGLTQMSMLTFLYYSMVSDNEEYKNLSDQEKSNFYYIFLPTHTLRLRVRPDMNALLGKVFPEAYLDLYSGRTDVRAFNKRMKDNAGKIIASSFMPTLVAPVVEGVTNYSFFTERDIFPEYMEGRDAKHQYNASTSELAKQLGEILNVSPIWIDHYMKGYVATTADVTAMAFQQILIANNLGIPPVGKTTRDKLASGPGMAAFLRQFNDNARTTELIYDLVTELKKAVAFESNLKTRKGDTKDSYFEYEIRTNQQSRSPKDARRARLFNQKRKINGYKESLKEYNEKLRDIRESDSSTSEQKRINVKALNLELKMRIPLIDVQTLRQEIYGSGENISVIKAIEKAVKAIIIRKE